MSKDHRSDKVISIISNIPERYLVYSLLSSKTGKHFHIFGLYQVQSLLSEVGEKSIYVFFNAKCKVFRYKWETYAHILRGEDMHESKWSVWFWVGPEFQTLDNGQRIGSCKLEGNVFSSFKTQNTVTIRRSSMEWRELLTVFGAPGLKSGQDLWSEMTTINWMVSVFMWKDNLGSLAW